MLLKLERRALRCREIRPSPALRRRKWRYRLPVLMSYRIAQWKLCKTLCTRPRIDLAAKGVEIDEVHGLTCEKSARAHLSLLLSLETAQGKTRGLPLFAYTNLQRRLALRPAPSVPQSGDPPLPQASTLRPRSPLVPGQQQQTRSQRASPSLGQSGLCPLRCTCTSLQEITAPLHQASSTNSTVSCLAAFSLPRLGSKARRRAMSLGGGLAAW